MTGKTKKELQAENIQLKEELSEVKLNNEILAKKCKALELKCSETVTTNNSFICKTCEKIFENMRSLKKHQSIHKSQTEFFKCSE